ncbi:MAG: transglutaminase-like domain-containing protein [Burkholderiales bacterium]|nr:transglutaminase-like domain-containing protein [Burkholderiales bacterium]
MPVKPPPLLLGLALAFWGASAGALALGIALGIAVELLLVAKLRRAFDTADFNRACDLAAALSIGAIAYFVATLGIAQGLLRAVEWLPVTVLPALLAQIVSAAGRLRMRNLFYSLRRSALPEADRPIDLAFPYFALALLSASIATTAHRDFVPAAVALLAYALWAARPRTRPLWAWATLAAVAVALGIGLSMGLVRLQLALEDLAVEWLFAPKPDIFRATTRIGDVGRVKLSDAIVWRVQGERPAGRPLLLFEAAYGSFDGATWRARSEGFQALPAPVDGQTWQLGDPAGVLARLQISGYTDAGRAILALPAGSRSITNIAPAAVAMNALGSVRIADAPPFVRFHVAYAPGALQQTAPDDADFRVPRVLAPLFADVAAGLAPSAGATDPEEAVARVRRFFAGFRYSLWLGDRAGGKDLRDFLTVSRAGHCEYFATATALLLRSMGVPARYAVGYSVQEWSGLDGQFVVRRSHAHAWAQAYVGGAWVDVDTTPAIWVEAEAEQASWLRPLYDRLSWLWYRYNAWRAAGEEGFGMWLLGGAVLVCAWLYWRLFRRPRTRAGAEANRTSRRAARESAYFQVEDALAQAGYPRGPGETPRGWLARLAADGCPYLDDAVHSLVAAHYELEYRPGADRPALLARTRALAEQWRAARASPGRS